MSDSKNRRDLARLGRDLGDDPDRSPMWTTTLRALASAPRAEFGASEHVDSVAAQVFDEADDVATPSQAAEFASTFVAVYDVESLSDVDALLGRESHERANYQGQLAFVAAEDDDA